MSEYTGPVLSEPAAEKLCLLLSTHRHRDWADWNWKVYRTGGLHLKFRSKHGGRGYYHIAADGAVFGCEGREVGAA